MNFIWFFSDGGRINITIFVNNVQAKDLAISFTVNPLSISVASGSTTPVVVPLATITTSFDLLMACTADSFKFYANGQQFTSIINYHFQNGILVQPVVTQLLYTVTTTVVQLGQISWNYGK